MSNAAAESTGADLLVDLLSASGFSTVFCISGAGNLAILDALQRRGGFTIVYGHHEQAVVMAAQGFSRTTGRPGLAIVTTGGGASNAITGILSAYLDSVPVLVIAGNESTFHCDRMKDFRAYGVQGFDAVSVARPVTKLSCRIVSCDDIAKIVSEGLYELTSGRPGPVLIDFPMDIQRGVAENFSPEMLPIQADRSPSPFAEVVSACAAELCQATQPLIYLGNGVRGARAHHLARQLIADHNLPYILSWSAMDLFPDSHPLNVGRVGIYGDRAANILLQRADFLLCIGTRLAIPQIGYDKSDFARRASRWVVDIDSTELTKFDGDRWSIVCASSEGFLEDFLDSLRGTCPPVSPNQWVDSIHRVWSELPRLKQVGPPPSSDAYVHSIDVIGALNAEASDDAIIVTDVGAGLLSGHYALESTGRRRIFTSQGLGEMGFGLPGSIGAHFAAPDRQLICLDTDGAIMFNLQELQVVAHHKIPLKLFVFNNGGYSMIRISQDNLFAGRRTGVDEGTGVSFPNFEQLALTFSFDFVAIRGTDDLREAIRDVLGRPSPVLVEIVMDPDQRYLPRLATSQGEAGTLISPPLEDLDPKLPIELLEHHLGYTPMDSSFAARGLKRV